MFKPNNYHPSNQTKQIIKHTVYPQQFRKAKRSKLSLLRYILGLVPPAAIASTALFILQCLYVVLRTPRLPPPPLSGVEFIKEGIVATCDGQDAETCTDVSDNADLSDKSTKKKEFRLILIGDSPVEGIGNNQHSVALCGQTAKAFANHVCKTADNNKRKYDYVRYWSFGKSGLTARGIEKEIVPLLHSTADYIEEVYLNDEQDPAVNALILLCGVNNVLSPSTPSSFANEVSSLLTSIRNHPQLHDTPILVLGLPDFARLPFLPSWPMGWILGWKGRRMQYALESVITKNQTSFGKVAMVQIPEVQDVIESRGYHRLDSNITEGTNNNDRKQFITKFCHPLLRHLGHDVINANTVTSLGINDFLCDDGFHPGRYGTIFIGSLLSEAYEKLNTEQ